jgi:outer membrane protein assembly factor BamD
VEQGRGRARGAADKLYNEGLFLLNDKKDIKAPPALRRGRAPALFRLGAQVAADVGLYLLRGGPIRGFDHRRPALRPVASWQPGRRLCAILIGTSFFDQIRDITRDQDRTERAIAALDEVVRKYPNTEYAVSAKRKIEMARDQLAGKEMLVGRYYMERRDFTGAINRFKIVVRYQTTRHVEEALLRLTESYLALGIVGEAQTSAAVLGHNFPSSRWYQDAYKLVREKGLEPAENRGSWISQAFKRFG